MTRAPVVVEREGLLVGRQAWRLRDIRDVWAEERPPDLRLPLATAGISGMVALPLFVVSGGNATENGPATWLTAGLVLASILFFTAVARLLSAQGRYCLVIETAEGVSVALETDDHQQVMSLLAQVTDAASHLRAASGVVPGKRPVALT